MDTRVLTILFSDIKGFTNLTSTTSRENLSNLLKQHEYLLTPIVENFGGRVVKMIGDALLAVFESPTNAIHCAIMMQLTLKEESEREKNQVPIHIRISLNTGEVELKDNDVYGEAVNVASRLEKITGVDEIYFTESVFLSMNRNEVGVEKIGYRQFKGVPHEVKIYRVIQDDDDEKYKQLLLRLRSRKYNKKKKKTNYPERNRQNIRSKSEKRNYRSVPSRESAIDPLSVVFIILFSLSLLVFGYVIFFGETSEKLFTKFQDNMDIDNFDKAEVIVQKLYSKYQNSPYTIKAVERLVDDNIEMLLDEEKFEKASDYLRNMKNRYPFIDRERWNKKILLGKADKLFRTGDRDRSELIYQRLLMDFPNDSNIKVEYEYKFSSEEKGDKEESDEADSIREHGKKVNINEDNSESGEQQTQKDEVLKEKSFSELFDFSSNDEKRIRQKELLERQNRLEDINRLRYYYFEMINLSLTKKDRLEKSVELLEKISQREDWDKIRKIAGLDKEIKEIRALSFYEPLSKRLAIFLSEAFKDEVKANVFNWMDQKKNNALRLNAFYIMKNLEDIRLSTDFYMENLTRLKHDNNARAYFDLVDISIEKVFELMEKSPENADTYKTWLSRNKRELENIRREYQYDTKGILKTDYINRLTSMIKKIERKVGE